MRHGRHSFRRAGAFATCVFPLDTLKVSKVSVPELMCEVVVPLGHGLVTGRMIPAVSNWWGVLEMTLFYSSIVSIIY